MTLINTCSGNYICSKMENVTLAKNHSPFATKLVILLCLLKKDEFKSQKRMETSQRSKVCKTIKEKAQGLLLKNKH